MFKSNYSFILNHFIQGILLPRNISFQFEINRVPEKIPTKKRKGRGDVEKQ